MKKEESKILEKFGKESGFKVPENYFADFNAKLSESLPEVKITEEVKPTMWERVRPFVYMAAMFAGVWLMMNIFSGKETTATMQQRKAQISAGLENEKNVDELMNYGSVSEYDYIMNYEDSLYMETEENEIPK